MEEPGRKRGEEGEGEMKLSGTIHIRYCSECTDCE